MAVLRHPDTDEKREIEGEVPIFRQYLVESFDDETDELIQTPYVDFEGESWIVEDDGVETFETG
jgi:hypothetical protein